MLIKEKGRRESNVGPFFSFTFHVCLATPGQFCAEGWKDVDHRVKLGLLGLSSPCSASPPIRQGKGVTEVLSLRHTFSFLICCCPDSPWATEAGKKVSLPSVDNGPGARNCPLQLSQESSGSELRNQGHMPRAQDVASRL